MQEIKTINGNFCLVVKHYMTSISLVLQLHLLPCFQMVDR